MISLSTRIACAVLSLAGATGLVTISAPAVAIDGARTAAPAPMVAAVAAPLVRQG